MPFTITPDFSGARPGEDLSDMSAYQSDVGVLRFVVDTTHSAIALLVGMLGRQLHNPAKIHGDAIKPMLRYLSTRLDDGPVYQANVPLTL